MLTIKEGYYAVSNSCMSRSPIKLFGVMLLLLQSGTSTLVAPVRQTPQPIKHTLLTTPVPDPGEPGVWWFASTGHTLRNAFLAYWNKYGGLAQFGYPITEEFVENVGPNNEAYRVQYFERNRFEYHPENAGTPSEVLLGTLGRDFRTPDPPSPPLPSPAHYFAETGHNVSGAFKLYWETHGGLFVHGYPITEPFEEKNPIDNKSYLVQYFERSRFELHPENAGSPHEVLLGLLGVQLAQKKGYGGYPLYGHAPDFSWVAGRHYLDPTMCPQCGCDTIRLAQPPLTSGQVWRVQPVGSVWKAAKQGEDRISHLDYVAVIGRTTGDLSNPSHSSETCYAPEYIVEQVILVQRYRVP